MYGGGRIASGTANELPRRSLNKPPALPEVILFPIVNVGTRMELSVQIQSHRDKPHRRGAGVHP
jgi:hypothetical protein